MMTNLPLIRIIPKPAHCRVLTLLVLLVCLMLGASWSARAYELSDFKGKYDLQQIMPGATSLGPVEGSPPSAVAYKGEQPIGYVFLNSSAVSAIGYSGKPIHVVVGVSTKGIITGARMVKHHEPIVLIGIPEVKIHKFVDRYVGLDILALVADKKSRGSLDIVSGATVTVMVIDDTIIRAAIKILRQRQVGGAGSDSAAPREKISRRQAAAEVEDWQTLLGDGSVRRLTLSLEDVNHAFAASGDKAAAARPEIARWARLSLTCMPLWPPFPPLAAACWESGSTRIF